MTIYHAPFNRTKKFLIISLLVIGFILCLSLIRQSSYTISTVALYNRALEELITNNYTSVFEHFNEVHVYHLISWNSGHPREGYQSCDIRCYWHHSPSIQNLSQTLESDQLGAHHKDLYSKSINITTVSVYNIHEWKHHDHPALCMLPTDLTMAESEESKKHRSRREDSSFQNYDGHSTTHSSSTLQRSYKEAVNFHESQLFPIVPYNKSILGASFLASNCVPTFRNNLVKDLRKLDFRVDGLGPCLKTENISESIIVNIDENTDIISDYHEKKQILSRYLFHLAIENDIEPGHITEKVYHALISGSVPIYLGGDEDMKKFSPDPLAVIFVSDYENISMLVDYLKYLISNETAYERHRAWRKTFNRTTYNIGKPSHITDSWHCNVCKWAVRTQPKHKVHSIRCPPKNITNSSTVQSRLLLLGIR